ncbi:hypothetical protein D3C81_2112950 [compost metagenome]
MAEQMLIHEAAVALRMIHGQTYIFIQIKGGGFGETNDTFVVHFHQLGIYADRRASGSQTKYGFGIALQQTDNQIGSGLCEILIILKF